MGGGFYGDIIIIGAIAAFIILRYRAMLGDKAGRDVDAQPRPLQEFERVIQLPSREPAKIIPEKDYGALGETFAAMQKIDRQFTVEEFLDGARGAFEMVVEAYNEADRDTLKMLLAKDIYAEFDSVLTRQREEGKVQHTTLVAIVESTPTDASLSGNKARVTVKFVSEQVLLVKNDQGEVVEGDPSHQEAVEDSRTFERNLAANDPAWKVIET